MSLNVLHQLRTLSKELPITIPPIVSFVDNVFKRSTLKVLRVKSFLHSFLMAKELILSKELPITIYDCNLLSYFYDVLYFNYVLSSDFLVSNFRLLKIVTAF